MTLDPSVLRSRLREALRGPGAASSPVPEPIRSYDVNESPRRSSDQIAEDLGGTWRRGRGGSCLVVERRFEPRMVHGSGTVGCYGDLLARCAGALHLLSVAWHSHADGNGASAASGQPVQPSMPELDPWAESKGRVLFFDLETTGLSGGAGTYAFLIGCGWFEDGAFVTRQLFLAEQDDERQALGALSELLEGHEGIVTFNGRTFDVPLIEMRYQLHREPSPFEVPHLDVLHPARRLWRRRRLGLEEAALPPLTRSPLDSRGERQREAASCALQALEAAILGFRRSDDVPSAEIPSRYFQFLRTRDARPLESVLEHNRLDLLSLGALTAIVVRLVSEGPDAARDLRECLGLGRLYERAGDTRAEDCYLRTAGVRPHPSDGGAELVSGAFAGAPRPGGWDDEDEEVRADALRILALGYRRNRRHAEAAEMWSRLRALRSVRGRRDAAEALAIHHEHRVRDLESARAFALEALAAEPDLARREAIHFRLSRIERKLARAGAHVCGLPGVGDSEPI